MSNTTVQKPLPLKLEQAVDGLTDGAIYALRYVCELLELTPRIEVASGFLLLIGANKQGRIGYFDYVSIKNERLLTSLQRFPFINGTKQASPPRTKAN